MNDVYTPGAVSSLIHLQTSAPEKSKEQKKLDRLFGKTKKTASPTFVPQVTKTSSSNDVSNNVTVTLKSPKKRLKTKIDVPSIKAKSRTQKEEEEKIALPLPEKKSSKKMGILTLKTKHKDKTNQKFEEISTGHKESKKRKIMEVSTTTDLEGNDDTSSTRKKKKTSKKNNDTVATKGDVFPSKRRTKINPPVINDVLCARKESDGSKPRTRYPKPELSDLDNPDEDEEELQQRRKKRKRDKLNDYRTVFVGNLPLSITKKQLKKMFSPCGEIENLRMRGAIPANPNRGKKYAILKKAYHSKCKSINGYICFVNKESVSKACETMNSKEIEGQYIRVNPSIIDKNTYDRKLSVFVGNLPFVISEEEVRKHFLDCGEIANIRLVKDWKTGIGKGFGYIKFEEADSAKLAIRLNNSKLNKRNIRVSSVESDPKKRREEKVEKETEKAKIKKKNQKDFVGLKAEKKTKKKKDKPKHLARKMGLTKKKKDLKPVEKVTSGPNKHMVFE